MRRPHDFKASKAVGTSITDKQWLENLYSSC